MDCEIGFYVVDDDDDLDIDDEMTMNIKILVCRQLYVCYGISNPFFQVLLSSYISAHLIA